VDTFLDRLKQYNLIFHSGLAPFITDISTLNLVPSALEEYQIECLTTSKDYYLYYFDIEIFF